MIKRFFGTVLLLIALPCATPCFAGMELIGGVGTSIYNGANGSVVSVSGGDWSFGVTGGASVLLLPSSSLQATARTAVFHISRESGSTTVFHLLLGPTLNIEMPADGGLADAFYVRPLIGFNIASAATTDTDLFLELSGGKRFSLSKNISYAPGIALQKIGDAAPIFNLVLFNLSWFL